MPDFVQIAVTHVVADFVSSATAFSFSKQTPSFIKDLLRRRLFGPCQRGLPCRKRRKKQHELHKLAAFRQILRNPVFFTAAGGAFSALPTGAGKRKKTSRALVNCA